MVVFKPISEHLPLLLASRSPRRQELLRRAGVPFRVVGSSVEERVLEGEEPAGAARRLALEKAQAVQGQGSWVLAADTIVVVDQEVLGKPVDRADGARMLAQLQGREHQVMTGFALLAPSGEPVHQEVVVTGVRFRGLDEAERTAYLDSGEPFGKAGAYAIQGIGAAIVQEIHGSYTNVVGLPLCEVLSALTRSGALQGTRLAAGLPALEEAP